MTHDPQRTGRKPGALKKWIARVGLALVLLMLLLFVSLWTWGHIEAGNLREDVAAYRATGDPLLPDDFNPVAQPPDDRNAAVAFRQAAELLLTGDDESWQTVDLMEPALPLSPEESRAVRRVLDRSGPSLLLTRRATTMPSVDWGVRFKSPVFYDMFPRLNGIRDLSRVLQVAALDAHQQGDDAAAVAYLRDGLCLAHALEHNYGLVPHLVALGVASRMASTAEQLAPDLRTTGADSSPNAAIPQLVRALVDDLLDDRDWRDGGRRALLGERLFQYDAVTSLLAGVVPQPAAGAGPYPPPTADPRIANKAWVLRGLFLRDVRIMMRYTTAMFPVTAGPDLPSAKAATPPYPPEVSARPILHLMARLLLTQLDRAVATHYLALADRRLAATAIALRCYASDHAGRWPTTLDPLVPAYLPAVPADPLAAGAPLRYRPAGPPDQAPVVYSIGEDGHDDGGSDKPARINGRPAKEDIVVHLARQPRPAAEDAPAFDAPSESPASQPAN